jgi:hypothetical protein
LQQAKDEGYCCVGGDLNLSTCEDWPLCISPLTAKPDTISMSCATKIPIMASDYNSLVESASSKYLRDRGGTEPSPARERPMAPATSTEDSNDKMNQTASRSSPSETYSGSNMTRPLSLVGGLLRGILTLLYQVLLVIELICLKENIQAQSNIFKLIISHCSIYRGTAAARRSLPAHRC